MRGIVFGVIAAAVLASAVAGCGSSSSDTSSTSTTISKAAFLKQGNAICKSGNKEINRAANKVFTGGKPTQAQINQFANQYALPSVERQVAALKALGIPAGDEAQVNAIFDAVDKAVIQVRKDPASIAASNTSGPFAKANQLAKSYGLTECG